MPRKSMLAISGLLAVGLSLSAAPASPRASSLQDYASNGETDIRNVWVKPVLTGGVTGLDVNLLEQRIQEGLDRFSKWSYGRLQVHVARVAPPVVADSHTCNGAISGAGHPAEYAGEPPPEGTHVLTAVFGPCYTTSLAPAGKSNWLFVGGLDVEDPQPQRAAIHEFGHNLGLGHANSSTCFAQSSSTARADLTYHEECTEEEYGDSSSLMGSGRLADADDLGAPALWQLGWLEKVTATQEGESTYLLLPYKNSSVHSFMALPDGYALSYRPADRSFSFVEGAGVYLHDLDPPKEPPRGGYLPRSSSVLLPMTQFIDGAQPGMHVLLPGGKSAFRVLSATPEGAKVQVIASQAGVTDIWGPGVLSPYRVGKPLSVTVSQCVGGVNRTQLAWAAYDPSGVARAQLQIAGKLVDLPVPKTASHYPALSDTDFTGKPQGKALLLVWDSLGNKSEHRLRVRAGRNC